MSTYYISRKLKMNSAKSFKDSFTDTSPRKLGYVFIGKATPYINENTASEIFDTVATEKETWDNMIGGKRIAAGDVEFVIPRVDWTSNTRYKQYDDKQELDILLTVDEANNNYSMYALNSEGNLYKCLCNNASSLSTIEPTGDYATNNGFITTADNYQWKYMYNIRGTNKFSTSEWIPTPYSSTISSSSEYNLDTSNLVDGSLSKIIVTNPGTNYSHTTVNVASFIEGNTTLIITDAIDLSTSNVKLNMQVSGTNIYPGTYITSINPFLNTITLSTPTTGTSPQQQIEILTRVSVIGDGTTTLASATLNESGEIHKITVQNVGIGYTRANVIIYGSGSGATARAVLPPKFGHGYSPATELGATNVMILQRIGDPDASEGGILPVNTSFRQYGLVLNPYKYTENVPLLEANSEIAVSQTTDLTLIPGAAYTISEFVYQGTMSNPTFSGNIISQTTNKVILTNISGTPTVGGILFGQSSGRARPVQAVKLPDLKPYVGDIVYAKNIIKVQRSIGQSEEIKLVFQF